MAGQTAMRALRVASPQRPTTAKNISTIGNGTGAGIGVSKEVEGMVRLLVIALAMTGLVGAPEPIRVSDAARACVVHLPPVARYVDFKATSTYDVRTDRWGKVVRVTGRETRTAGLMDSKAVENDLRGWNVTPAGRYEVRVTTGMGLAQATFYEVCRPNRRDCVRVEPRQPCPVFDRK